MTERRDVTAQQAYEAGVALLLKRARRVLAGREDTLTLLAGSADRWFRLTPWAELSDHDREFWDVIAEVLVKSGLGVDKIGPVLDATYEDAAATKKKHEAALEKCGKGWPQ